MTGYKRACAIDEEAALGFGPGDEELSHRSDEHVEVGQLADGARGYAAIAEHTIAEEVGT